MEKLEEHIDVGDASGVEVKKVRSESDVSESDINSSLSRSATLLLAVASGLAVANIYFAQPLLDIIAKEFGISHSFVGIIITITQICYALGLLFLVPLGDLFDRRRLVVRMLLVSVLALFTVSIAPTSAVLLGGMAVVGLFAVVVQVLVAFAATLAPPNDRGRVVGLVTSGVVIGILLARTIAGVLTDLAGWRAVYDVSAVMTLLMAIALFRMLPHHDKVKAPLSYPQLLRSVFTLFIQEPILRIRAVICLLIFTAFSILWTSLVLPLSAPPLSLSHTAIGSFGLAGVAGALAAARAGRVADRGLGQRTTGIALVLLLGSWLPISLAENSLWALIVGVVALDLAVQAVHVTNQSMILNVRPEARSRLTAGYMIFYSIGSAVGSISSTVVFSYAGWIGVCLLGASVSALALLFWGLTRRITPTT
ncbi:MULTISPECIES: MFS transporter [unclassified Paenibacillus]|uniref:MFS transporter n=1 Tax=unclassified Paenibacillus TaxID=185978 RepID=UPI000709E9D5|nr:MULTISPECIES: MFS transporter [unclassified Paenibacillus]KQX47125.1 transporter [Paenibacillus sp. Root444D2]KRE48177.1 transporter [Paenibacillus sp. Soil724D2]